MVPWWIVGIVAVGLLIVALTVGEEHVSDPEVIIVRSGRRGGGCLVVGAFLLGAVVAVVVLVLAAQGSG
ncbi:MAG TPA: hypothetical protein VFM49_10755 [Chloroflexia bacterium]|jgi:hypothetical protein|nr:hypothetical protein [Chloroflexia bacterium]